MFYLITFDSDRWNILSCVSNWEGHFLIIHALFRITVETLSPPSNKKKNDFDFFLFANQWKTVVEKYSVSFFFFFCYSYLKFLYLSKIIKNSRFISYRIKTLWVFYAHRFNLFYFIFLLFKRISGDPNVRSRIHYQQL